MRPIDLVTGCFVAEMQPVAHHNYNIRRYGVLRRSRLWTPILFVVGLLLVSSVAWAQDGVVTVLGVWGGQELEAFQKVMQAFTEKNRHPSAV